MIYARITQHKFRTGCICFIPNMLLNQFISSLCLSFFLLVFTFLLWFFTVFFVYIAKIIKDGYFLRLGSKWTCLLVDLCEVFPLLSPSPCPFKPPTPLFAPVPSLTEVFSFTFSSALNPVSGEICTKLLVSMQV